MMLKTKKVFTHEGRRPIHFYLAWTGAWALAHAPRKEFGPSVNPWLPVVGEVAIFWYETDEYIRSYKRLLKLYLQKPRLIFRLESMMNKEKEGFINDLKIIKSKVSSLNTRTLWTFYDRYFRILVFMFQAISIVRRLDVAGLDLLQKELSRNHEVKDMNMAITALCTTDRMSFLAKEERIFLRALLKLIPPSVISKLRKRSSPAIIKFLLNNKGLQNFLDFHLKKYAWVSKSYYNEPARTKSYYYQEIKRLIKGKIPIQKRLEYIQNQPMMVHKARVEFLNKVKIPRQVKTLAIILRQSAYLKDFLRAVLGELTFFGETLFKETSRRLHVSLDDLKTMNFPEIKALLLKNKRVAKGILSKRKKLYLLVYRRKVPRIYYGKVAQQIVNNYLTERVDRTKKEFRGRPASPGKAVGQVKIIRQLGDLPKFQQGNILVANNTTPDFVPAMKKAQAILTEEGGITIHAAIVSRELGIPCVVGLNHITRILKDGDKVGIDATRGIVRKLK